MASAKYNLIKEFPRDDTSESLLEDDSHSEANYMLRKEERTAKRTRYWSLVKHTLFAVSLFLNGVMWWSTFRHMHIKDPFLQTYSPARDVVEYKTVVPNEAILSQSTEYQGWPDDERDRLWGTLWKKGAFIAITEEEMKRAPNVTERVAKGKFKGQWAVGLAVSHQLHCLDSLRKSLYPNRYPKESMWARDGSLVAMKWTHYDHCLDSLRQAIMCHGDISLFVHRWNEDSQFWRARFDTARTCRSFDNIQDWASERYIEEYQREERFVMPGDNLPVDNESTVFIDRSGGNRTVSSYFCTADE